MERAALDRWANGDPSGFLEISAPSVRYFDPALPRRLNNHPELAAVYEKLRGLVKLDRYEMIDPAVQLFGDAAVLSFNFVGCYSGGREDRWNCTEVYARSGGGWRLEHTHWSQTENLRL